MKSALIIFVRNPLLGKVKTRIAKDLGDEIALSVYKKLLTHTHNITKQLDVSRFVFYADYVTDNDLWENGNFKKMLQEGTDLGERMQNAFQQLFNKGYSKVAIIGSDCYELTSSIIDEAFGRLKTTDVVIGPSLDGGYYLLGMNKFLPHLFQSINWSTENVFPETIEHINKSGYKYYLLPKLSDVDNAEDCSRYSSLLSPTIQT